MGAVARCVAADAKAWPVSDLVRLLLAVAKAKKAGVAFDAPLRG